MPPTQASFGQYILEDKIAQGGMAEIYRGRAIDSTGLPKPVVIKKILPHIAASKEFVDMLVDEAKIAVMCQHGNIAQVYDLGKVGEDYFIVMEYVDGKTLSQISKKCKAISRFVPIQIAVWCATEILAGLDYIHRKTDDQDNPLKIIHRDVSPQNVILSHSGTVKIVDFGIAKAKSKISTTDSGILKGKFAYMSPEQAEGDPLDHRSDIFSIGIVLYELLTNTRLFKGATNPETLKRVKKARVDPPSQFRRDLPEELDDIVLKALAKKRDDRYASAQAMHNACVKYLLEHFPDFKADQAASWLHEIFTEEELTRRDTSRGRGLISNSESPAFIISKEKSLIIRRDSTHMVPRNVFEERDETLDGLSFLNERDKPPPVAASASAGILKKIPKKLLGAIGASLLVVVVAGGTLWKWHAASHSSKTAAPPEAVKFFGSTRIEVSPPGAEIFIDGVLYGHDSPLVIGKLEAGVPHILRAERAGLASYTETFQLNSNEEKTISVNLTEGIKEPAYILVDSEPKGAKIFFDDIDTGLTSPAGLKEVTPDAPHKIGLFLDGYQYAEQIITVPSGKTREVTARLNSNWASLRIVTLPEGAEVTLNGKPLGRAPVRAEELKPGESIEVVAALDGFMSGSRKVELKPGENRVIELVLAPANKRK